MRKILFTTAALALLALPSYAVAADAVATATPGKALKMVLLPKFTGNAVFDLAHNGALEAQKELKNPTELQFLAPPASNPTGQIDIVTAATTLTEVLRGGPRDAAVHRVLGDVEVIAIDEASGRAAGELLGRLGLSGHRHALDALIAVVALAQRRPVLLLTSDPRDLGRLTEEPGQPKDKRVAVVSV